MKDEPQTFETLSADNKSQRFILSDGARIFYEINGSGIPMVMLHGNMQNANYFKNQIDYFMTYYQVITIDSRGHGKSDFGHHRLSLDVLAEDVIKILDELNVKQAIILGFSDGGNIAIKIAQLIPERLMAVIAVGSNMSPQGLKMLSIVPIHFLYTVFNLLSRLKWFDEKAQTLSLMIHEPNISNEQLNQIFVPVLMMTGQFDVIRRKHSQMIAQELPLSEWVILKHGGHDLLRRQSKLSNEIISAFLSKLERSNQ